MAAQLDEESPMLRSAGNKRATPVICIIGAYSVASTPQSCGRIIIPQNTPPSALFSISIVQPNVTLANLLANNFTPAQLIVEQKLASPLASFAQTATLVH